MKSKRPIFFVRQGSNPDDFLAIADRCVDQTAEPVVFVEPKPIRQGQMSHILDGWTCSAHDVDQLRRLAREVSERFTHIDPLFQCSILRDATSSRLISLAGSFGADLIVTSHDIRYSQSHGACHDEDLIERSTIPVWLVGHPVNTEQPIVAIIDCAAAKEENFCVIRTAIDSVRNVQTTGEIFFQSICSHCTADSVQTVARLQMIQTYLGECLKKANRQMQAEAITWSLTSAAESELADTINKLNPALTVVGCPNRSALRRCFDPGLLQTLLREKRSVLCAGPTKTSPPTNNTLSKTICHRPADGSASKYRHTISYAD